VPATRRRRQNWKGTLCQLHERGGSLEIALDPAVDEARGDASRSEEIDRGALVWRVRILDIDDAADRLVVESPVVLGRILPLVPGTCLVGVMAVGQTRWRFRTTIEDVGRDESGPGLGATRPLVLAMPDAVQRCTRRQYDRLDTRALALPGITCWPLLDPASAAVAERASEERIRAAEAAGGEADGTSPADAGDPAGTDLPGALTLPEVGPPFRGRIANVGGGGLGLLVERDDADGLRRHRLFWLRIALPPVLDVPLGVTARLVHTHMDSQQRTYAGMSFEFGHNRSHQRFVVEQFCRFVAERQAARGERADAG